MTQNEKKEEKVMGKGRASIKEHEGKKYLRAIYSADPDADDSDPSFYVDVYAVLVAFDVTCPATAHAIKKLLCAGQRGKGSRLDDLKGAMAALNRAIDLEEQVIYETAPG